MTILMKRLTAIALVGVVFIVLMAGCGRGPQGYDDTVKAGKIERVVHKRHAQLFRSLKTISTAAEIDTTMIANAAAAIDGVLLTAKQFPATVESRFAYDALAYGAAMLADSTRLKDEKVTAIWETGLLLPLFRLGDEAIRRGDSGDSVRMQVLRALQRGMGPGGTSDMVIGAMPLVGSAPSPTVMQFCEADTVVFRHIYNLLQYARSLQELDPPLWMLAGPWCLVMDFEGELPLSALLVPRFADGYSYLTFSLYQPGDWYTTVFNDPSPKDTALWDAWFDRAESAIGSLKFDAALARRISVAPFDTFTTHFYADDYIIASTGDTTKKEFYLSFTRRPVTMGPFDYVGIDSLRVTFTNQQIQQPDSVATRLSVTRHIGASSQNGVFTPSSTKRGDAWLFPTGVHDLTAAMAYRDRMLDLLKNPPAGDTPR